MYLSTNEQPFWFCTIIYRLICNSIILQKGNLSLIYPTYHSFIPCRCIKRLREGGAFVLVLDLD